MLCEICFSLDQSKILSSGNELNGVDKIDSKEPRMQEIMLKM